MNKKLIKILGNKDILIKKANNGFILFSIKENYDKTYEDGTIDELALSTVIIEEKDSYYRLAESECISELLKTILFKYEDANRKEYAVDVKVVETDEDGYPKANKKFRDFLETEEFYNLMQEYRNTPVSNQEVVTDAFENIKYSLCEKL